jgi:stearoyl-CoA desaturase (Delta-9 desaturase)
VERQVLAQLPLRRPRLRRAGCTPGEIDTSAAVIRTFQRLGWVHDVRWPKPQRLARTTVPA